jgi:hypothetical protein
VNIDFRSWYSRPAKIAQTGAASFVVVSARKSGPAGPIVRVQLGPMVVYRTSVSVPSISGAIVSSSTELLPWQPSTWPEAEAKWNANLSATLRKIFDDSILAEIDDVIADAKEANGGLEHRGYVIAIALMCSLDAVSSYGYEPRSGNQIPDFVKAHFPTEYREHADELLKLYRHALVHSWHLFEVAVRPGDDPITVDENGVLCFGLLHLRDALSAGIKDYFETLGTDTDLQNKTLKRYKDLRATAKGIS